MRRFALLAVLVLAIAELTSPLAQAVSTTGHANDIPQTGNPVGIPLLILAFALMWIGGLAMFIASRRSKSQRTDED